MTSLAHALWLTTSYIVHSQQTRIVFGPVKTAEDWATSPLVDLLWKDACR